MNNWIIFYTKTRRIDYILDKNLDNVSDKLPTINYVLESVGLFAEGFQFFRI